MRSAWQEHVAKTRKRGNRKGQTMTHQQAMKAASETWPKEKQKLIRRKQRECKKKLAAKPQQQKNVEPELKNEKASTE